MVDIRVGGKAAQKGDHPGHVGVQPGGGAVLCGMNIIKSPEHVMPDFQPPRKQTVQGIEPKDLFGIGRIKQVSGHQTEEGEQGIQGQHQPVPQTALKKAGKEFLGRKQDQKQDHGHTRAPAQRPQKGVGGQCRQPGPVVPAQPGPAQPAPGHENAQQTAAVAVVMSVPVIPVAGVHVERNQGGGVVQQLHQNQAGHGGDQVNPQDPTQVGVLGAQSHQYRRQKPGIAAADDHKGRIDHRNTDDEPLNALFIVGEKQTFHAQKQQGKAGQSQPGQMTESGQSILYIGTEHFRKNQKQHNGGTVHTLPQFPAIVQQRGSFLQQCGRHRSPPFLWGFHSLTFIIACPVPK